MWVGVLVEQTGLPSECHPRAFLMPFIPLLGPAAIRIENDRNKTIFQSKANYKKFASYYRGCRCSIWCVTDMAFQLLKRQHIGASDSCYFVCLAASLSCLHIIVSSATTSERQNFHHNNNMGEETLCYRSSAPS